MITSIGEFEVKSELGHGGMGIVYLAHDPRVGRDVAIKVLTNQGDEDLLARFRSEAGTTAKLTHKNIVTIYAFGDQEGMPYIVMELLQGANLGDVIAKRQPLTLLEKVDILHQAAEGLSFAHQKNVIHRDIKPRNIMLLPDGTAKVMDFGIARVTGSDSTRRTQKGYLIGTIAYMAPEQFTRGTDADQLVDIFAYGDVAYELITGQHPFGEGEAGALISRITSAEPIAIRTLAPDCPEMLASIIQQLLAKDRDLRYQSLKDLLLDMEPVLFQLRHYRAAEILAEAQPLAEQGQLEAALAKVKEAVELDPMNRQADQLKKQLQEKLRRTMVRGKVTSLVADAERKIAQRSFSDAILLLESALQLDKTDTIRERLEDAVREQDKLKRAVQLLGEAKRQQNLKTAIAKAAEALEIDPHNTQAPQVLQRLREELEKRERRLREALQGASVCAAKQAFGEAFRILDKVAEEQGQLPEIADERERVRAALLEFKLIQQQRSFDEEVVAARAAMNSGDLAQARAIVESLATGYADLPHAAERSKVLSEELARRERSAEIARIAREAGDLVRLEQFESGHAKLDAALARYPGDPEIQAALENLLKTKAARERAEAITAAAAHIGQLNREGSLEAALRAAKDAASEYPDYKEFQDLVAEIAGEVQEAQRRAKIDEISRRATALLETDPFQAGELLQSTLAEVGPEAYLESLLTAAQRAAGRRREQQAVDGILATVQTLRASKKLSEAVEELERAIVQFPRRSELRLAASEVRLELDRTARAAKLRTTTQAIQKALADGDLHKCGALIDAAREELQGEASIEQLAAELARARRAQQLAALTTSVRQSLSRDDVEGAARQLAGSTEQIAATPEWKALKAETDERREYLKALEEARKLAAKSQFNEAEQLLALYVKAGHKRAAQMQTTISQQRRAAEAADRDRKEQERKSAEARAVAAKELERKGAEARALELKEQERKAAEARAIAAKEQERKAAEARAIAAKEQERKVAEARTIAAKEQERKAAETLALSVKEHEAKSAAARDRERKEQELRNRLGPQERHQDKVEDPGATSLMPAEPLPTVGLPVQSIPRAAKPRPLSKPEAAGAAAHPPVQPVETPKPIAPPRVNDRPVWTRLIYRRPVLIAAAALVVIASGFLALRHASPQTGPTPTPGPPGPPPASEKFPRTPKPIETLKKNVPDSIDFGTWLAGTSPPRDKVYKIPKELLGLISPHWQKSIDERLFHAKIGSETGSDELIIGVASRDMAPGNYSVILNLDLSDGDRYAVSVSIIAKRWEPREPDTIIWRGTLGPQEILTIQGTDCSSGNVVGGELPSKSFQLDARNLKENGLTEVPPSPSAQNGYKLQLRNSRTTSLSSFRLLYFEAK
jgi:serine/threonine-protein kinase